MKNKTYNTKALQIATGLSIIILAIVFFGSIKLKNQAILKDIQNVQFKESGLFSFEKLIITLNNTHEIEIKDFGQKQLKAFERALILCQGILINSPEENWKFQTPSENEIQDEILAEPKAFSPNGDGYNDELTIRFKLNKPGFVANVRLFDAAGRLVKFLVKNQTIAQEGNWVWDGENDSGQKMNMGVYIIQIEVFEQQGHRKQFKTGCPMTDRLE